jgi:hypothetical protein
MGRPRFFGRTLTTRSIRLWELDMFIATLEETFGVVGAKTIGRAIAKQFYLRMELEFFDAPTYGLQEYLEHATKLILKE